MCVCVYMYVCTYSKTTPSPKINKDLAKQRLVILMMFLWKLQILRVKLFIWGEAMGFSKPLPSGKLT